MSDDEGNDDRAFWREDLVDGAGSDRMFGEFSVLSPGVHIVLDGRPVSRTVEG